MSSHIWNLLKNANDNITGLFKHKEMKRIVLYPYRIGSKSGRLLSEGLGAKRVRQQGSYVPKKNDLIVNWGNSHTPQWYRGVNILNDPRYVRQSVNKIDTLKILSRMLVNTIPYTLNRNDALRLFGIRNIVERKVINGHGGEGVHIPQLIEDLGESELYTKFIPNAREYRVHVFKGEVIDVQQKKRREGSDASGRVKNLSSGWVFCRDNISSYPSFMLEEAVASIDALDLDFGAVDIIVKDNNTYVLEVNTAIGMEGETISKYVNAIKKYASK